MDGVFFNREKRENRERLFWFWLTPVLPSPPIPVPIRWFGHPAQRIFMRQRF